MFVLQMERCKSNRANSRHPFCSRQRRNVAGHVIGGCMVTHTVATKQAKDICCNIGSLLNELKMRMKKGGPKAISFFLVVIETVTAAQWP